MKYFESILYEYTYFVICFIEVQECSSDGKGHFSSFLPLRLTHSSYTLIKWELPRNNRKPTIVYCDPPGSRRVARRRQRWVHRVSRCPVSRHPRLRHDCIGRQGCGCSVQSTCWGTLPSQINRQVGGASRHKKSRVYFGAFQESKVGIQRRALSCYYLLWRYTWITHEAHESSNPASESNGPREKWRRTAISSTQNQGESGNHGSPSYHRLRSYFWGPKMNMSSWDESIHYIFTVCALTFLSNWH